MTINPTTHRLGATPNNKKTGKWGIWRAAERIEILNTH
jgi:hypothetical protein